MKFFTEIGYEVLNWIHMVLGRDQSEHDIYY